jgi:hypothetical protein
LVILYARHGNEGTYANITAKMQALVKGSSFDIDSVNQLGVPDPFPGRAKALVIVYRLDGKVYLDTTPDSEITHLGLLP